MRVYLCSLGCRLNQSEVETLARQFVAAGCSVVDDPACADICAVNTCAVTQQAEKRSQSLLQDLRQGNPETRLAALGCWATLSPSEASLLPGVEWVVSNKDKHRAIEIIAPQAGSSETRANRRRTRALVKVQDGCDSQCTYCITRALRGPSRSRPTEQVVAEIQDLVGRGYHEIVLTGVSLGSYGFDREGSGITLRGLIQDILSKTDLLRLRLSSLEPWTVDPSWFELWRDSRLCRHLHLPLQSGCDKTLRRMGRRNTVDEYVELVQTLRAAVPDIAVTTDVMVGFPGEGDQAFGASCDVVASLGFARLHVFPFSDRPGTLAAEMDGQIPLAEKRERARRMRELGRRSAQHFRNRFVGRELDVLWERRRGDEPWSGLTDNYLRVVAESCADLYNQITPVRIVDARDGVLQGVIKQSTSP